MLFRLDEDREQRRYAAMAGQAIESQLLGQFKPRGEIREVTPANFRDQGW